MPTTYKIKNNSGAQGTWAGQVIDDQAWHIIDPANLDLWRGDAQVMADVASGSLIVGNDNTNFEGDPTNGWNFLAGEDLPRSKLDGRKVSVHTSYKPEIPGVTTYAVWIGAGDDMVDSANIGGGSLLDFSLTPGSGDVAIDVKFHPDNGRVWLHEGYVKFSNGGSGDYMTASVVSEATPLQTSVDLDLEVDVDNWIKFASGGAGTGTHGWADANKIVLVPRTFSKDGDWDYDGVSLTPNTSGTGKYKISDIERIVHKYVNKVPCRGSSPFFSVTSDETTELPANYFLRVTAHNISDTTWDACVIMEIYRERTHVP